MRVHMLYEQVCARRPPLHIHVFGHVCVCNHTSLPLTGNWIHRELSVLQCSERDAAAAAMIDTWEIEVSH